MAETLELLIRARNAAKATLVEAAKDLRKVDAAMRAVAGGAAEYSTATKQAGAGSQALSAAQAELSNAAGNLAGQLGPLGNVLSALGPGGIVAAAGIGAVTAASVLALSTLREWTQGLLESAGALTDQRDETGLSLRTLQEYGYVAAAAGVSQAELASGVQRLSRTLAEGGDEAAAATKRLNLSFAELRRMAPDQQFMALQSALDGVSSAAQRAAILKDFGLRDPAMVRVMAQDVGGLRQEFEALGLAVADSTLERFDSMGDELAKLDVALASFKSSVVEMVFGSADASAAIRDLTALVADAGAAVRDAAPLFEDFYRAITGSSLKEQIAELRQLVALAREAAQPGMLKAVAAAALKAAQGGGIEFEFAAPARPRQAATGGLSNGGDPGLTQAQIREAEERAKRLRELMEQLGGAAARKGLDELAAAVAKLGGLGGVAAGEYQKLKEQVRGLAQSAPVPDILKPLLVTAEMFGPTLKELGIDFDVLGTRNLSGLSGQIKQVNEQTKTARQTADEYVKEWLKNEKAAEGFAAAVKFAAEQMGLPQDQIDKLTGKTEEVTEATIDWSGVLSDVRNAFDVLGISADTFFGKVLGGLSAAMAAGKNFDAALERWKKATTGKGKFEAGVGMGLAGLQAAGAAYQSGSMLGGAASGAAFGFQVGGPIGAAIGGVAGGILGLFGGKAKVRAELADLRKQLLDSVGGSMDELRKRASSLGVDISRAFSTKSPKELKAIIEQLNKAAEEQKKRWEGVQTAIAGLQLRAGGFAAHMERVGEATAETQAEFDRLGRFAVATFGQYVRESGDVIGALREMDGALDALSAAQERFGFAGSRVVGQLLGMRAVLEANQGVADSLQGLNQLMKGLGDAGGITKSLFQDFATDAGSLFQQLIAGGADANTAMALMQPTLQQLWESQQRYGTVTDETTAALLRQAEEQGLVGENMKSVNEQILTVLVAIGEALGATIPDALRRMGSAAEREFGRFSSAAGGVKFPNFDFGASNDNPDGGANIHVPSGPHGPSIPGFAVGGTVHQPTLAMVGERGTEHIMSTGQLNTMIDAAVARALAAAAPAAGGVYRFYLDGAPISARVERDMESGRVAPRRGPLARRRSA